MCCSWSSHAHPNNVVRNFRRRSLSKAKEKETAKIIILRLCAKKEAIYSHKSKVNSKELVSLVFNYAARFLTRRFLRIENSNLPFFKLNGLSE